MSSTNNNKTKRESDMLPVLMFEEKSPKNRKNQSIKCVVCEKCWIFPNGKDEYLAHLFMEHRLVIADIEDIGVLEDYLLYWTKEFQDHDLEYYCSTMLLDQLPDGRPGKNEKYFLLSDIVPKDSELRHRLKQKRLEQVLAQHQYERTDRSFSKECLLCRNVINGLRADYLEHLFEKHFLLLGKPENLVFIDEMLDKVEQSLNDLICIYCGKHFKDRAVLKEHMRKKGHKRINEKNREYDKYFLINYRQEKPKLNSKSIRQTKKQSVIYPKSTHEDDDDFEKRAIRHSDDSDSDWADWLEQDNESLTALHCLFCPHTSSKYDDFKSHLLSDHNVDFGAAIATLNFYERIKVVNYVRRQMVLRICVKCELRLNTELELQNHLRQSNHYSLGLKAQWDRPEYFFPTFEDDGLLWLLDDNPQDDMDETVVRVLSEDPIAQVNKDAERLSLENLKLP